MKFFRFFSFALWGLACALRPAAENITFDLRDLMEGDGRVTRVWGLRGIGDFGVPVAGGFDCDGDGFNDFAVAHFMAGIDTRFRNGEVNLVFGDGTIGSFIDLADAPPTRFNRIYGKADYEGCGSEIWMDDVDGDGLGDLLICRQNFSLNETDRRGIGALTILFGNANLRTKTVIDFATTPADPEIARLDILGEAAYDRLGIWVRTGDMDGDGTADILVAADQTDNAPNNTLENNRGAVYVIRGGSHLRTVTQLDLASYETGPLAGHVVRIDPPVGASNWHFGGTVQVADLDGNGRAEAIIGATLNRAGAGVALPGAPGGSYQASGGAGRGRVYIAWDDYFTSQTWPADYQFTIMDQPALATRFDGLSPTNGSFGEELIGGLDFDGDGHAELFIGDLTANPNGLRSNGGIGYVIFEARKLKGRSFVINNPQDLVITTIYGPEFGAIGADTVTQGDFDGDGLGDLAIGSPHENPLGRVRAGTIVVLYGQQGGWPEVIDLAPAQLTGDDRFSWVRVIGANGAAGADSGDTLCYSAAWGDIDQDGLLDILTNEMVGNGLAPGSEDVGNMLVIKGNSLLKFQSRASIPWMIFE